MERSLNLSERGIRDRASSSIQDLRATLNSSPRRRSATSSRQGLASSPRTRSSSRSARQSLSMGPARGSSLPGGLDAPGAFSHSSSHSRLNDGRALDNYNNAVDRLRTLLLSHSQKPSRSPRDSLGRSQRPAADDYTPRSSPYESPSLVMEGNTSYKHSPRRSLSKPQTEPNPQQLLQIINSQSAYIQQIEGENKYCKEELHGLKGRTEAVVAENTRLNDEMKEILVKTALEESPFRQEDKVGDGRTEENPRGRRQEGPDRIMFSQWSEDLEKLKKLHEIRVRRLEDQLENTKTELSGFEKQCSDLKNRLRMAESVSLLSRKDNYIDGGLCVRCAQEEAVVANPGQSANINGMHRLTQERDDLVSRLTSIQAAREEADCREEEAYEQVQQSIQLVEQAQLERTEALVQTEQAKEDIVRLQRRMAELVTEQQEKLRLEREATRRESHEEIGQFNHKMTKLSEEIAGLTNQLDRVTREKVDIMADLDKAKMQIMQNEVQITKASEDNRMSATTAKVQRDEAMRQLDRLRSATEIELRDAQQEKSRCKNKLFDMRRRLEQEKSRSKNELFDVRRRLEQAEKDASTSREEGIRLVEKLNAVEREANIFRLSHESVDKGNRDAMRMLRHRSDQKEQDLRQRIHDMDSKHTLAVTELENMLSDQQSLITKLREEGRVITDQMESGTTKYRSELRHLKQMNAELMTRSERLSQQHSDMEIQCIEHGKLHKRMKARLHQMEEQNNKNAKQIFELLQKQTSLMQERQVLSKEVEFLRTGVSMDLNHSEAQWMKSDVDKISARKRIDFKVENMIPSKELEV